MKKLLLIISLLISVLGLNAQSAIIGDLEFTVTSETPAECVVSGYSGEPVNVMIPSTVTISGKECAVTSIGEFAFRECFSITSITFEENTQLTSIGRHAFFSCSYLISIEIPSGVTSIGDCAFIGCFSLISIEIPGSVTSIGANPFAYCQSLTSIVVESGNTFYDSRNNCNAIIETATNTLIAVCQKNTVIPSGITSIGDYAFGGCFSLICIDFGDNSQLTSIGNRAFSGCSSLTSMDFGENSKLTSIGDYVFDECSSLTSIEIPSSVTSIGDYAFNECSSLTSITFEENAQLASIGNRAFSGCSSLTSIEIPGGITSVGDYAFIGCFSLTSIEIPSSVTSIGEFAFAYCRSLTSIYCYAEIVPETDPDAFYDCPSDMVVYVTNQSVDDYKASSPWNNYTIIPLTDNEDDNEDPGEGVEKHTYSFNIYPNPVNDKLYIETEVEIETVSIFDIYGRIQNLSNSVTQQLNNSIDVSNLNSGVYFVKIVTNEGEVVKRFIKK